MFSNMVKSLIEQERIETTLPKAKELRRFADKMITLAKEDTLASRRRAISFLKIQYNPLTSKEQKQVKKGDLSSYNTDRKVLKKLFGELKERYLQRQGGYTRIIQLPTGRAGDNAASCYVEYLKP
jgi:large subunit ribosomal protein L17